ncbi:MAG: hypothetical protein M3N51_00065 [Actinomycetota bacterium]|nr:hypothetical protein [Actinomycetota bacterium]
MERARMRVLRTDVPVERIALLATSAVLFASAFRMDPEAASHHLVMVGVWALYGTAFGCLVAACVIRATDGRLLEGLVAMGLALAVTVSVAYEIEIESPLYGTDSLTFSHMAAQRVIEGENPYALRGAALARGLGELGLPPESAVLTRLTDGSSVDVLSPYPALHFLSYVPFVAVGLSDLRWANLLFELFALAAIWLALPRTARLVALPALLLEPNITVEFTAGGVTDWLWVLPVILVAIALSRNRAAIAALTLGIACAVKQQVWFAVPFVLVWLARRAPAKPPSRAPSPPARYGTLVLLGFLAPNLPFILWSAGDWVHGVLYPAVAGLMPAGRGASLLSSLGLVGLPAEAYASAVALVMAVGLFLYARYFSRLQHLLWVFPTLIPFVAYRSLHNYFVAWLPVILLWTALHHRELRGDLVGLAPDRWQVSRATSWGAAGAATAAFGLLLFSIAVQAPLGLHLEEVEVRATSPVVEEIQATLVNEGGTNLELLFNVMYEKRSVPWVPSDGNVLHARSTSDFLLRPAGPESIPVRSTEAGAVASIPFRLQVHLAGDDRFVTSDVLTVHADKAQLANPTFSYWIPPNGPSGFSRPLGWLTTSRAAPGAHLKLEPLDATGGLRASVDHEGRTDAGWVEVGLHQTAAAVQACYEAEIWYSVPYAETDHRPSGAVGLQVHQGDVSLWYVPSATPFHRITDLADGTRVVELPSRPGTWQHLLVPVAEFGEPIGLDIQEAAVIKVFSALSESREGTLDLWVRHVHGVPCSGIRSW